MYFIFQQGQNIVSYDELRKRMHAYKEANKAQLEANLRESLAKIAEEQSQQQRQTSDTPTKNPTLGEATNTTPPPSQPVQSQSLQPLSNQGPPSGSPLAPLFPGLSSSSLDVPLENQQESPPRQFRQDEEMDAYNASGDSSDEEEERSSSKRKKGKT